MQRGFSLIELMVATTLIALFFGMATGAVHSLHQGGRVAARYVDDLAQIRRAVRVVEADLLRADRVTVDGLTVELHQGASAVSYELESGVLSRTVGKVSRVVARRIREFVVRPRGRIVDVRIVLARRNSKATSAASVETSVCLRREPAR